MIRNHSFYAFPGLHFGFRGGRFVTSGPLYVPGKRSTWVGDELYALCCLPESDRMGAAGKVGLQGGELLLERQADYGVSLSGKLLFHGRRQLL